MRVPPFCAAPDGVLLSRGIAMYGEADVVERNGGDTPAQRAFEAYTAGLMEELCKSGCSLWICARCSAADLNACRHFRPGPECRRR